MAAARPGLVSGLVGPLLGGWTWYHEVTSRGPERPWLLVGALALMGFSVAKLGDWLLTRSGAGGQLLDRLLGSAQPPGSDPSSPSGPGGSS